MEENASQALMMAFAIFVFVIALSLAMFLFSKVSTTSETLALYADSTRFYDNVAVVGREGIERYVNTETIIPTLYRYYKENFCVKIYDATEIYVPNSTEENPGLIQIFDVLLEDKVGQAVINTAADGNYKPTDGNYKPTDGTKYYQAYALKSIYNDKNSLIYMFGAPWLDSTENMKLRVDYFINGDAGYINNTWVDYTNNPFHKMRTLENKYQFKEKFISYSYTGETMETEDGDVLVTGADSKDKIVITYTLVDITNVSSGTEKQMIQDKLDVVK